MKTKCGKWIAAALACVLCLSVPLAAAGCAQDYERDDSGFAVLEYPDYPETPGDKNSWEYIEDGTDLTIDWYVDISSWASPSEVNLVRQEIKEQTGITVNFETPVDSSGNRLSTMLAGGDLPDVITVASSNTTTMAQMAQQGYAYDINTLAEKWAPSLFSANLREDVLEWWALGNGKTYGIPNHYYSYEDIPEDERLQPNGGMMVRKDMFDDWQAYVENTLDTDGDGYVTYTNSKTGSEESVLNEGYITTPDGFKAACVWAMANKSTYGIDTGLQLSQFTSDGCASLTWLSQFFSVSWEDAETGEFIYDFTNEEYLEVLLYVNELYNAGVISQGNFSQNYDGVGSVIAGGRAFASAVTPQDYQIHYNTAREAGYEYVSLYITDYEGNAPILGDIRGYGYMFNMITTSCERPDLVIKLFDYLTSEEGQRLICFGPEGTTWNWSDGLDSDIVYTDSYLEAKANNQTSTYGLMSFDVLINYQYYDNVQPKTNNGKTEGELFRSNLKRPLTVYSYDFNAMNFIVDTSDEDYMTYSNNLTRVDSTISSQLTSILRAESKEQARQIWEATIKTLNARGLEIVLELQGEAFLAAKEKLGLTFAYPANQSGYAATADRANPNGDLSLYRSY